MHPVGQRSHTYTCGEKDADTASPRALHTGLLRAVYMFTIPRVHAADIVDSLPKHVGKPEFPDTGWDRIKDIFDRRSVYLCLYLFSRDIVHLMHYHRDVLSSRPLRNSWEF